MESTVRILDRFRLPCTPVFRTLVGHFVSAGSLLPVLQITVVKILTSQKRKSYTTFHSKSKTVSYKNYDTIKVLYFIVYVTNYCGTDFNFLKKNKLQNI